jgi:translation initiation factor 3 subunit M
MDKDALLRKIRLLSLASIASARIGRDVPYAEVAAALQVPDSEVETWAIDGACGTTDIARSDSPQRSNTS